MEKHIFNDPAALLRERKDIITATVRATGAKRIPINSMSRAWPILDAGYTLLEAFNDYDKNYDAMMRFQEMYNFDYYTSLTRFTYRISEALGGGGLIVDNEKGSINYVDELLLYDDEYDDFIEMGKDKFFFERVLPRKYGLGKSENTHSALELILDAMKEQVKLNEANAYLGKRFTEVFGLPRASGDSVFYKTPIDLIQSNLRGLKKMAVDMRRMPHETLMKALYTSDNGALEAALKKIDAVDIDSLEYGFHSATTSTTIWQMSAKQFEKFDLPFIQKFYDKTVEKNALCFIFPEGGFKHLTDYYRELPAGHFAIFAEDDDINLLKELKAKLPNMAVVGGMPLYYLGHMSKQQCVDKAKEVVDELGFDGRLLFSTNKMLSTKNDANGENLRAVNDFVHEYGRLDK